MLLDRHVHPFQNITTLEGSISSRHMALAGVLNENGEHPLRSTSGGSVTDEVPGPDMPLVLRLHRESLRVTTANDLPFGRKNSEAERSPQALDVPLAHVPSLLPKPGGYPAITVPGMLVAKEALMKSHRGRCGKKGPRARRLGTSIPAAGCKCQANTAPGLLSPQPEGLKSFVGFLPRRLPTASSSGLLRRLRRGSRR